MIDAFAYRIMIVALIFDNVLLMEFLPSIIAVLPVEFPRIMRRMILELLNSALTMDIGVYPEGVDTPKSFAVAVHTAPPETDPIVAVYVISLKVKESFV